MLDAAAVLRDWTDYWRDAPDADSRVVLICRAAFVAGYEAGRQSMRDEAPPTPQVDWLTEEILKREG